MLQSGEKSAKLGRPPEMEIVNFLVGEGNVVALVVFLCPNTLGWVVDVRSPAGNLPHSEHLCPRSCLLL